MVETGRAQVPGGGASGLDLESGLDLHAEAMRVTWRWAVVAAVVTGLAAVPALAGALPADGSDASAEQLLAQVRASSTVAWSGYGESRGSLVLPDVRELAELPGLLGGATRTRAWWRGPDDWRVDALTLVGETDTTRDAAGGWTWESADRRAVRLDGELDVRLPAAADLMAPTLGLRLAGTSDTTVSRLPARRVAGRGADGLRLTPRDPAATTIGSVDLWVDPASGLPLQVEVRAVGESSPSVTATLLDLDLSVPPPERTRFVPAADATTVTGTAPDLAALADRFAPYQLPSELTGLPRRARSSLSTGGGVGTYGDGFTALALVPVPQDLAHRVIERVDPEDSDDVAQISTPLVNGVVGIGQRGRAYLLVGSVPVDRLEDALEVLRDNPPRRVR